MDSSTAHIGTVSAKETGSGNDEPGHLWVKKSSCQEEGSHTQLGQSPQLHREYRLCVCTEIGRSHEETARVPLSTTQAACVWFIFPAGSGLVKSTPALSQRIHGMGRVIQGSLSSAVLCPCREGSWCSAHPAGCHLWTLMSSGRPLQALCAHSLPVGECLFSAEKSNGGMFLLSLQVSCHLHLCASVQTLVGLSGTLVSSTSSTPLF